MPHSDVNRIKVAEVDELPPGKGKTATIHGREITVFNEEGRFVATASVKAMHGGLGIDTTETTCQVHGHHFDTGHPALSPDRLRIDEIRYQIEIDDGSIYIIAEGV
jgi:nitrite reductase/ring-hydroxylating ferredoxin subunit